MKQPLYTTNDIVEEMLNKFDLPIDNQIFIYRAQYRIQQCIKKGLLLPIESKSKQRGFRYLQDSAEEFIKHIGFVNGSFVYYEDINGVRHSNIIEEIYEIVGKHKNGKISDGELINFIYTK